MSEARRPIRPVGPAKSAPAGSTMKKGVGSPVSPQSKRSAYLIMLGLPLFLISSVVLYRRVIEGKEKRKQLGEYTPDGGLRLFSLQEKEERDNNTWFTWIFGKDTK